ncbi:MAG: NADH:flavin oxidoreductase/NADH oxidase family protein [Flavobacteriaceae bacterium]
MKNLRSSFQLPNGTVLQNRIAKSAMSENIGSYQHAPTSTLIHAYKVWAAGAPGLLITGNIMVDSKALGEPRNVVVEDYSHFEKLQEWAASVKGTGVHLWPQINHPGRQAFSWINQKVVAPSAVSMQMGGASPMFKKPQPLSEKEIWSLIKRFGTTARILKEAGFTGCQIHGAHGYLVSQFLSPKTNQRTDQWGGSLENRARFAVEIYKEIRQQVGTDYPIGIKINSADFQRGGFSEFESIEVVSILSNLGIDLIEISGGTYEKPTMVRGQKKSTQEREAYFIAYVEKVRKRTQTPLMLTGGFRTLDGMEAALDSNCLDIVGLARPFCLHPQLPKDLFGGKYTQLSAPVPKIGITLLDKIGGVELPWYEIQIQRLGQGKMPKKNLQGFRVFLISMLRMLRKALAKN